MLVRRVASVQLHYYRNDDKTVRLWDVRLVKPFDFERLFGGNQSCVHLEVDTQPVPGGIRGVGAPMGSW
jgi:hypothetical protein